MKRAVGSFQFQYIGPLIPSRTRSGAFKLVRPQSRYKNREGHSLHAFGRGSFCSFSIPAMHQASGVYLLTVGRRVMYVGECVNLANRFNAGYGYIAPRACIEGGQSTNCKINRYVLKLSRNGQTVRLWFRRSRAHKILEDQLITAMHSQWNGRRQGQRATRLSRPEK